MTIMESGDDLRKNAPNEVFRDLALRFTTAAHNALKVSAGAVLHNDVDFEVLLVDEVVSVLHNAGVLQIAQDVDLSDNLLLFLLIHAAIGELLPHKDTPVALALDLGDAAEAACKLVSIGYIEGAPLRRNRGGFERVTYLCQCL